MEQLELDFRSNAEKRKQRLDAARAIARHYKFQWLALIAEFEGRCVRCGTFGGPIEKDHIIPIYQGGSDGINNLQPLCRFLQSVQGA